MSEIVGKIEQLTETYYTTDIYKPKILPPRAKQFRDTFFSVVDDMRRRLETDDIFDADAFIKKLEDMKPDVDYLCVI